jgi:hypothetical protein
MEDILSEDLSIMEELQTSTEDEINNFISNHLDNMIDIFLDFEERFSYVPEFLEQAKKTSTVLVSFIIDYLFKNVRVKTKKDTTYFEEEYKNEINNSYNIIFNFVKYSTGKTILLKDWINFCYCMSH